MWALVAALMSGSALTAFLIRILAINAPGLATMPPTLLIRVRTLATTDIAKSVFFNPFLHLVIVLDAIDIDFLISRLNPDIAADIAICSLPIRFTIFAMLEVVAANVLSTGLIFVKNAKLTFVARFVMRACLTTLAVSDCIAIRLMLKSLLARAALNETTLKPLRKTRINLTLTVEFVFRIAPTCFLILAKLAEAAVSVRKTGLALIMLARLTEALDFFVVRIFLIALAVLIVAVAILVSLINLIAFALLALVAFLIDPICLIIFEALTEAVAFLIAFTCLMILAVLVVTAVNVRRIGLIFVSVAVLTTLLVFFVVMIFLMAFATLMNGVTIFFVIIDLMILDTLTTAVALRIAPTVFFIVLVLTTFVVFLFAPTCLVIFDELVLVAVSVLLKVVPPKLLT